ncbi:MAG: hypothetical protein J6M62_02465 [Selenomonadaceae bacterium]|nr:hypothetical protein [Selenomonadaceae bacterium]MBP3723789.1 hypothetical protein [Selenomonadaceae bacterium]
MRVIFGLCEHCLSPLQVAADYESNFKFLPNVYAFLMKCPVCQSEYVHFEDKEEN